MESILRRPVAVLLTLAIIGGAVYYATLQRFRAAAESARATAAAAAAQNAKESAAASGWTMYGGGVSRNPVNTVDKNIPSEWNVETGTNVKWSADLGSKAYGGPIVGDGKIFIGTNNDNPRNANVKGDKGVLMCFRESDGKFLWQAIHDKLPDGRVKDWPHEGICSSPVVEGKRLYYVSNRCELVCADTEGLLDGKNDGVQDELYKDKTDADIIWRLDMIGELKVFPHNLATCSPMIVGDTVYLITSNGVDEGHINIPQPKAPSFIAVNKQTGKVIWTSNLPGGNIMHGQWSNPVWAEPNGKPQVIFPGGDGWMYGLNPKDGTVIWKFDGNPKSAVYKLGGKGTKNDFLATPVVHDNKLYIGVGQDPEHDEGVGHLWCIDITKQGDVSPVNDNFNPQAPENKNSALVWHYGGSAPKGADRNYIFGRTLSTCAIHDGLLYVGELAGYFHCLDAKTGKKLWDHDMQAVTWSSPYVVDGKVLMGNDGGKVLVFEHGREKKDPKEIDMAASYVRASPVVANGVLYIITESKTKLYAIVKK